ncbi:hypothetical protein N474_23695 [Pseudoalteromonas luteoviolacea CPMOR-2]|uniref:2-phospho-L-lactate transferase CofD family protein n=1 Tax=Pseudoalteromonas luteoviolacea TaxID=43657 RepID=UPI0007B0660D|nr:2-phospho-L-lactate transferase CofD family protein [Pseudoalteromonas luteoviolacea]KZN51857.1 hypothetical protein N474_23695 [Pseudoalteromonas luteoviolacea CPMOR-2]
MNVVFIGAGQQMLQIMKKLKPLCQTMSAICATPEASFDIDNKCALLSYAQLETLQNMSLSLCSNRERAEERHTANLELLSLMCNTPSEAISIYSKSINSNSCIYPMSDYATDLVAITQCGSTVVGTKNIDALADFPHEVFLSKEVPSPSGAIEAIAKADLLIFGPCNPVTDLLPLLLIPDIKNAVLETSASRLLIDTPIVGSLLLKGCSASRYLEWMKSQIGYQFFDIAISNQFTDILSFHYRESKSNSPKDIGTNNTLDMMDELFKVPTIATLNAVKQSGINLAN